MATKVPSEQAKSKVAFNTVLKSPSISTKKAPSKCLCLICDKNIVDASTKNKGLTVKIQSFVKAHVKVGYIEDVLACLSLYSRLSHLLSIIFHFTAFIVLMFVIRNKSKI